MKHILPITKILKQQIFNHFMPKEIIAWDLSNLYSDVNDPKIKTDMKDIEKLAKDFKKIVKGNINNPNLKP